MSQNPFVTICNKLGARYGGRKISILKNTLTGGAGESTGVPLPPWQERELPLASDPGAITDLEIEVLDHPPGLMDESVPAEPIPITIQSAHDLMVQVVEMPGENKWRLIFDENVKNDPKGSKFKKLAEKVRKSDDDEPKVNVGVGVGEPPQPSLLSYKSWAFRLIVCVPFSYLFSRFVLNLSPRLWAVVPIVSAVAGIGVWLWGSSKEKKAKK